MNMVFQTSFARAGSSLPSDRSMCGRVYGGTLLIQILESDQDCAKISIGATFTIPKLIAIKDIIQKIAFAHRQPIPHSNDSISS